MKKIIAGISAGLILSWASGFSKDTTAPVLDTTKINAMILFYANIERADRKILPLSYSLSLEKAASWQAQYMTTIKNLSHEADSPGMRSVKDRIEHFGGKCMTCGENVIVEFARNYTPRRSSDDTAPGAEAIIFFNERQLARQMVKRWMESEGHRKNILSARFGSIGTGTARGIYSGYDAYYSAQVFSGEKEVDFRSLRAEFRENGSCFMTGGEGLEPALILLTDSGEIVKYNGTVMEHGILFDSIEKKKGKLYAALYDRKAGMYYPVIRLNR